jgi:hypothetical protein
VDARHAPGIQHQEWRRRVVEAAVIPPGPPVVIAAPPVQPPWKHRYILETLIVLVGIGATGILVPHSLGQERIGEGRLWAWGCFALILVLFLVIAGRAITGVWLGAFIDDVNKISLSRLQLIVWTIVIVSAFMAAAFSNVLISGVANPLGFAIPGQVLQLLGISTASLIGATLISEPKKNATPNLDDDTLAAKTGTIATQNHASADTVTTTGVLISRRRPQDARWSDLVMGVEIGNGAHLDISRVQMLFFTIVLVSAYAVALGKVLDSQTSFTAFPSLDTGMITLLGISQVGYLAIKAAPHTPAS